MEERLDRLENHLADLAKEVYKLAGEMHGMHLLIKYVVLPLIIILGGLVGIKVI